MTPISWVTSAISYFQRDKCVKYINYDKRVIEIKGLSSKIPSASFDIGEFRTEVQKVREASEIAQALDDYQVLMCKICQGLGKDDVEWRKYFDLRASTIQTGYI
jgi:protein associated with RNAse G/E